MKAETILREILKYWPEEINISDGKLVPETNGFISNNLSRAWDYAEKRVEGNDWYDIGVWAMFSLLHSEAERNFKNELYFVYPSKIKLKDFKNYLPKVMKHESYKEMLAQYKLINKIK